MVDLFKFMIVGIVDFLQYCQEFIECFDILRRNDSFCDVIIVVKGEEFKVYKDIFVVLSLFFCLFLESGMRESNEYLIRIDFEEVIVVVMEGVVKYIYIGNVLVIEESGYNFIVIVDYFLLLGLKRVVGNFIKDIVIIENCVFNYYFVIKYQCLELREKLSELICINFSVVLEIDDFLNFDVN